VLVFPEGISHDQPALAPLRTGAARMALDAAGGGVRGLRLLPLGLVFERKEQLRSRVLVRAGVPIDLDAWRKAQPAGDAARLTAELDQALRGVTLNFASDARAERAVTLARVLAAITEVPPSVGQPRDLATEAALAERIERATEAVAQASPALAAQADAFTSRAEALEARLAARGATLADLQISPRLRHGARFVVRESLIAVLALPLALLGHVMHWLPLRLARTLAMRPLASDPSRDQPAMRTIVLGLATVLVWYALQFALVAHWLGAFVALAWLVVIFLAARVDFLFDDRMHRARARARTYLALRRDPALREQALAEIQSLLAEAVALESALLAPLSGRSFGGQ
jgi:glycerol-3-phosphate O-acyltransferase/dihydroxyacetone phosphate acyltransferase